MANSRNTFPWTQEEVDRMKDLISKGFMCPEVAHLLDRSANSVSTKSIRLGLRWQSNRGLPLPDGSERAKMHYGEDATTEAFLGHLAGKGLEGTARHYGISRDAAFKMKQYARAA